MTQLVKRNTEEQHQGLMVRTPFEAKWLVGRLECYVQRIRPEVAWLLKGLLKPELYASVSLKRTEAG